MSKTTDAAIDFENYLKEIHSKHYMGTDDDMPDAFENWLVDLSSEDLEVIKQAYEIIRKFK